MTEDTISTDTFIQPKITGYRQLTEWDAQMINVVKAHAEEVGKTIDMLLKVDAEGAVDARWVHIAKTDLQKGFMALVRAIAQPTSF